MTWVPLQVHSQYSILDASASVKQIAKRSAEFGMPAVAITDHGNLFGAVEFFKSCRSAGVKPIIGCEFYVAPESRELKKRIPGRRHAYSLVLLAKNDQGYHNLCRLSAKGFIEGFYYYPRIDWELLSQYSEGLIALSGHLGSSLAEKLVEYPEEVDDEIEYFSKYFQGDFFLNLQRHQMTEDALHESGIENETWFSQRYEGYIARQEKVNKGLLELAKLHQLPYVATNDSHYMDQADAQAHEILLNIQSGEPCEIWERDAQGNPKFRTLNPKRKVYPSREFYFKSPEQMLELFADLPEAISNTLRIAEQCQVDLDFDTKHYPVYDPPSIRGKQVSRGEQAKAAEAYLWELCEKGISERYTPERLEKVKEVYPDRDPLEVVRDRLKMEMSIIAPKGMCDYLLIVWDFIHWAKENGIPVGPGRGSGAGAIVNYLIGITDIEPLRFNLFFERFINPERLSYPDIDVDICMEKRSTVIEYTLRKYGYENVAQIVTFGTMKAKMAIKDVGRVLSVPLARVNAIAKLVPEELNMTIEKALEIDADLNNLYQSDEEARRLIDLAKRLEGSIRNTGIHAAGVIICGDPLTDHIPVFRPKDAELIATQYSMKPVEAVGMLKVDFLGLKTLTCIQTCVQAIKKAGGKEIDWINLPLEDKNTFDLLNQGKTLGVFQLESTGMQDLARKLRLDRFEEIIAVTSLYRPGPMDMIPSFIARKHGLEPIEYDHPWMKDILDETYGIMVYQEQVMQVAQRLANYSLGEGDVLRRAMGKKDLEEMSRQREKFRQGCHQNQIDDATAMHVFDNMEKFASYGFNKSHAAAYSYIAYVTAFLKANYPSEWMAALMTCDRDDTAKVGKFIRECQVMGIAILPPDVNEAGDAFAATPKGIRFAMSGIKGVGHGVVEAIIEQRDQAGPFKDLYDFFKRLDPKKVGKKAVELMVQAGCFDFTGWSRDEMLLSIDSMHDAATKERKDEAKGALTFFSLLGNEEEHRFSKPPKVKINTSKIDILLKEKELLGFFLTGHPLDAYKPILQRLSCVSLSALHQLDHETVVRAAFVVESVNIRISHRSQKKFAILVISDGLERFELPIWPELFEQKGHLLEENRILYAVLVVEKMEGSVRLSCKWVEDLSEANDSMIEDCDRAYDKSKHQIARSAHLRQKGDRPRAKQEAKNVTQAPKKQVMTVELDLQKVSLGRLLTIRNLFREAQGSVPLRIHFQDSGHTSAVLHIDDANGVTGDPDLLKSLSSVEGVALAQVVEE